MKTVNESGITPTGRHVLVQPHQIEETTEGGIVLPTPELEKHQQSQSIGTFIEAGPDAYTHGVERIFRIIDSRKQLVEERVDGYSEPFAEPGDRISFGKYAGQKVLGEDGVEYRLLNDVDVLCRVTDGVKFTDIEARQGLGS